MKSSLCLYYIRCSLIHLCSVHSWICSSQELRWSCTKNSVATAVRSKYTPPFHAYATPRKAGRSDPSGTSLCRTRVSGHLPRQWHENDGANRICHCKVTFKFSDSLTCIPSRPANRARNTIGFVVGGCWMHPKLKPLGQKRS